jgi:multiple sugar transport system permease protein
VSRDEPDSRALGLGSLSAPGRLLPRLALNRPDRTGRFSGRRYRRMRETRWGYLYVAPALLILIAFTFAPTLFVVYISFFNWNLLDPPLSRAVGLSNFSQLVGSADFLHSLFVTAYFAVATVALGTAVGLFIALALNRKAFGRSATRLAVFSPYVTPLVATSIIWVWIFNPQFGLANAALHAVGLPELQWLESTTWALPAVVIFTLWHNLGFTVIIFLAGLTTISQELSDAARVDGADAWQEFRWVTLPQLTPTVLFVVIISTVGALQAFTQFYNMTGGGPLDATTTTSYLLYEQAFVFYRAGPAAALAVVLFVITAALTLVQLRLGRNRDASA